MIDNNTKPDLSKKCSACKGTGHDKNSHPVTRLDPYIDEDGRPRKRHVTIKQGSGCYKCHGTGEK